MTAGWFRVAGAFVLGLPILWAGLHPTMASAEWYAGGYGGISPSSAFHSVNMPTYGQQLAFQQFPAAAPSVNGATLTQTFKTSNVQLDSSPIYGAKAGYFFTDEKLPWLGVEVEVFTNEPNIKAQTLSTRQEINYTPNTVTLPCAPGTCPEARSINGTLGLSESSLRVITVAANVIVRYPGRFLQPYLGVGVGAFYFRSSGQIEGQQVVPGLNAQFGLKVLATKEWGFFVEGKYNMAEVSNLDPTFGFGGMYSIFHAVGGIAYHF